MMKDEFARPEEVLGKVLHGILQNFTVEHLLSATAEAIHTFAVNIGDDETSDIAIEIYKIRNSMRK